MIATANASVWKIIELPEGGRSFNGLGELREFVQERVARLALSRAAHAENRVLVGWTLIAARPCVEAGSWGAFLRAVGINAKTASRCVAEAIQLAGPEHAELVATARKYHMVAPQRANTGADASKCRILATAAGAGIDLADVEALADTDEDPEAALAIDEDPVDGGDEAGAAFYTEESDGDAAEPMPAPLTVARPVERSAVQIQPKPLAAAVATRPSAPIVGQQLGLEGLYIEAAAKVSAGVRSLASISERLAIRTLTPEQVRELCTALDTIERISGKVPA